MLEKLKLLFTRGVKQDPDGLKQDQREAMIDLLLLCIYADNELDLIEDRIFDRQVERYNWKSEQPIGDYIKASRARTLDLIQSEEKRLAHLNEIGARLKKDEIKFRALKLCKILFYSDWELATHEEAFIKEIRKAFRLK